MASFVKGTKNIVIPRGDTYLFQAKLETVDPQTGTRTPIDLTGCSIKSQCRRSVDGAIWFSLNDYRLKITNAKEGEFSFKMLGSESTKLFPPNSGESNIGYYDVQFSKNVGNETTESIITYFQGTITIDPDITQEGSTIKASKTTETKKQDEPNGIDSLVGVIKGGK